MEVLLNKNLVHDGGYTPDGLKYIAKKLKTPEEIELQKISTFEPMRFVDDWDREWVKYPL